MKYTVCPGGFLNKIQLSSIYYSFLYVKYRVVFLTCMKNQEFNVHKLVNT